MALPTTTDLRTLVLPGVNPVQYFKIANVFQEEFDALPDEFKSSYEYDEETRTFTLTELEWLKWRQHGPYYRHTDDSRYIDITLGGSDIAVLFDGSTLSEELFLYDGQHGSNFKCATELFYEKTGRTLPLKEKKDADIFWVGHNEEPSIRAMFKKKWQDDHPLDIVEVINDTHMYQCGMRDKNGQLLYPFVLCDLDALVRINGVTGVLECKTCNKGSEDYKLWKRSLVPLKYYLQVCWYMLCMNLPYGIICVKWGLSLSECKYIYIERNFEVEKLIIEMAQEFITAVKQNKEPSFEGQNMERLFVFWRRKMGNPKPDVAPVHLDTSLRDTMVTLTAINEDIASAKIRIADLEKERNELLTKDIFPLMGDASEGIFDYSPMSNIRITLKNNTRVLPEIDEERLMKEKPDLYKLYLEQKTTFDKRRFLKEQPEYRDEYLSKDEFLTDAKLNYCDIRLEPKLRPHGF